MNTLQYMRLNAAETDGAFGSWLSSFLKCGSTRCPSSELPREQVIGQVALQVTTVLQSQGKMAAPADITAQVKAVMDQFQAYQIVMTDAAAVSSVVAAVVNNLSAMGKVTSIVPATPPTVATPGLSPSVPITPGAITLDQNTLLLGGMGLLGVVLLAGRR